MRWGEESTYSFFYEGANGGLKEIFLEVELYFQPGRFEKGEVQRRPSWIRQRSYWAPTPKEMVPFIEKPSGKFVKKSKHFLLPVRDGVIQ